MKAIALFFVAVVFRGAVGQGSANLDQIFNRYAGLDNILQPIEFNRFWLHFDDDDDGEVSKLEFDQGWRREGFPNPQNAPLFFLELDRIPDETLNNLDFPHIFSLFDEDGDGGITGREMRFNWHAYFDA